jgi:hypothetical protein
MMAKVWTRMMTLAASMIEDVWTTMLFERWSWGVFILYDKTTVEDTY